MSIFVHAPRLLFLPTVWKQLLLEQFSTNLDNWELETANAAAIDTSQYVSSPSSVEMNNFPFSSDYDYIYLLDTVIPAISNCRVIVNWRYDGLSPDFEVYMRQQEPLVHRGTTDGFVFSIRDNPNDWAIKRYVSSAGVTLASGSRTATGADAWHKWKCELYDTIDLSGNPATKGELFEWISGAWVSLGSGYDTGLSFSGNDPNRIGLAANTSGINENAWFDDVEVWQKA